MSSAKLYKLTAKPWNTNLDEQNDKSNKKINMSKITISAVGDICLARSIPALIAENGVDYPFENVRESFDKADILMGNLESVYKPDYFPTEKNNNHFQALNSSVTLNEILIKAKFNVINQATNHALDCGLEGLKYTNKILSQSGFAVIGAGLSENDAYAMKIIEKHETKIGFLGYTDSMGWTMEGGDGCLAYFKKDRVIQSIKENKKKVDILIVSWHADIEFAQAPSIPRYDACHEMIDAGADAIICHHPHVPQGIEEYNGGVIVYSLGNFLFDTGPYQKKHNPIDSLRTFIFNIEIENKKIVGWNREYFKIIREECRPEPLNNEELKEFESHFEKIDKLVEDRNKVREEWHRISKYWLNEYWDEMVKGSADDFIKTFSHSYFYIIPNLKEGFADFVENEYNDFKKTTLDWDRPFSIFEKTASRDILTLGNPHLAVIAKKNRSK